MDSYIGRLKASMAMEADSDVLSETEAKLGCYYARAGQTEQAREVLGRLRSSGAFVGSPRVAIRGMLLESLIAFFGNLDPGGNDRAVRAHALATAGNFVDLVELTDAWLAHYCFNADQVSQCAKYLTKVLDHRAHDSEARLRGILVFADLNMYCGRLTRARQLYEEARLLAVDLRDQASIAAMLYNKAALAMNWLRVSKAAALNEDVGGAMAFLYSEIDSAKSYHAGAQQTSLSQLMGWMLARRELDAGQLSVAATMYRELVEAGLSHSTTSATLAVRVEYAECLLDLGDKVQAAKVLATFGDYGTERVAFDDELLLQLLKHKANDVLGSESPFSGEHANPTLARQRFCDALVRIRGLADDVDRAMGTGLH